MGILPEFLRPAPVRRLPRPGLVNFIGAETAVNRSHFTLSRRRTDTAVGAAATIFESFYRLAPEVFIALMIFSGSINVL